MHATRPMPKILASRLHWLRGLNIRAFQNLKEIAIKESLGVGKNAESRGFLETARLLFSIAYCICARVKLSCW